MKIIREISTEIINHYKCNRLTDPYFPIEKSIEAVLLKAVVAISYRHSYHQMHGKDEGFLKHLDSMALQKIGVICGQENLFTCKSEKEEDRENVPFDCIREIRTYQLFAFNPYFNKKGR